MSLEKELQERSESKCELCGAPEGLGVYEVPPSSDGTIDTCLHICSTCQTQLDMLFLDEETQAWAEAMVPDESPGTAIKHMDGNGAMLEAGDSVILTKDLNVKGANFTAKRGTVVRCVSLVSDNPEHIEGKINGQRIVILTKFVKKAN